MRGTVALALVLGVALLAWPGADAQDATVDFQKARARRESGRHRKAQALELLRRRDNAAARAAIKSLADADDRTALAAISTLCREDFSGARAKLESVFEDDERSDLVRGAAIGALLDIRKRDDASWSDVRGYVRSHTSAGSDLREMARSVAKRLWASEVNDG